MQRHQLILQTFASSDSSDWTLKSGATHLVYDGSNNRITFDLTDDDTDEFINYDMGADNISNDAWILRCELTFTTWNINGLNNNNIIFIGCYDNASPSGYTATGDALKWGQFVRTSFCSKLSTVDDDSLTETQSDDNPFDVDTATDTPFYLELKRVSPTVLEFRAYANSDYTSQIGSTITRATTSGVTDLRYITFQLYAQGVVSGDGYTGYIQNLKFYNDTTTTTQDEKTTVTDVPAGSEFEQTNDYKNYQRSAEVSVWSQILSSSYSQVNNTNTSEDTRMGQQFESGHANIGKTFDTVTIRLRNRYSSGLTYEIPMKVWLNGSTSSSHTSETTVTLDELQTGTTWDASAPYDDAVTYTFATPITIATNDIIGIQPSGGTTDSSSVIIREKNLAEADTKMISYRSGAWGIIFNNEDLYMTISLSPRWVERGTAI